VLSTNVHHPVCGEVDCHQTVTNRLGAVCIQWLIMWHQTSCTTSTTTYDAMVTWSTISQTTRARVNCPTEKTTVQQDNYGMPTTQIPGTAISNSWIIPFYIKHTLQQRHPCGNNNDVSVLYIPRMYAHSLCTSWVHRSLYSKWTTQNFATYSI